MRALIGEVLRFGGVGIAATLVHAGAASLFHVLSPATAELNNVGGFLTAFGVSFAGHATWTFKTGLTGQAAMRFFVIALVGFAASAAMMRFALGAELPVWAAQGLAILVVPPLSFVGAKVWAFRNDA
ncbi:MAG: GtrA family protein [Pseudomonadota bacterium]